VDVAVLMCEVYGLYCLEPTEEDSHCVFPDPQILGTFALENDIDSDISRPIKTHF
jgi:hypothetical protein